MKSPADINKNDSVIQFLFFAVLFFVFLKKISDYDIWFHLMFGKEAFTLHGIPMREFFVYTLQGDPAIYPEWGFGALFYSVYLLGGYWGMSILNALIAWGSFFFMIRATGRDKGNILRTIILLCFLAWCVDYRLVYRPEMFLYLALAVEWGLLETYRNDAKKGQLFIIPILAAVLGNIHPSALILIVVLAIYGLDYSYQAYLAGRKPAQEGIFFVVLALITVFASALNPYGFHQTALPLLFAGQTEYLKDIVEFYPTLQTDMKWRFLVIALLGIAAALMRRRGNISDWCLLIFFGYLGMKHVRNVALFAFAALIPISHGLDRLFDLVEKYFYSWSVQLTRALAMTGIMVIAVAAVKSGAWGAGVQPGIFPEETATVMERLHPAGRIFNYYATGGYLAWRLYDRGYPVFIDGRHLWKDRSYDEYLKVYLASPELNSIIDKYNVTSIAIPPVEEYNGAYLPLLVPICDDASWLLAGVEENGVLFLKKGSLPGLDAGLPKSLVWKKVIREAQNILIEKPDSAPAVLSLGVAYYKLNDFSKAKNYLKKYLAMIPASNPDTSIIQTAIDAMHE